MTSPLAWKRTPRRGNARQLYGQPIDIAYLGDVEAFRVVYRGGRGENYVLTTRLPLNPQRWYHNDPEVLRQHANDVIMDWLKAAGLEPVRSSRTATLMEDM